MKALTLWHSFRHIRLRVVDCCCPILLALSIVGAIVPLCAAEMPAEASSDLEQILQGAEFQPRVHPKSVREIDLAIQLLEGDRRASVAVSCPDYLKTVCAQVRRISQPLVPMGVEEGTDVVAGTREVAYVTHKVVGEGEIWVFAGVHPFLNEFIDQHDNVRLLYQLLEGKKQVLFDEFHHGYIEPPPQEQRAQMFSLHYLMWGLFILFFIGALSRAVRFGWATPLVHAGAPPSTEFTTAVGILYRDRGAASVLRHYVSAWRGRMARRFGVHARLPHPQAIEKLAALGVGSLVEREAIAEALQILENARDGALSDQLQQRAIESLERFVGRSDK